MAHVWSWTRTADPAIEALGLAPVAKAAAYELKWLYPDIVFTGGRRDAAGQARVMACNVIRDRKWIARTYRFSKASIACQGWVDYHPEATTWIQVQRGLESILDRLPGGELLKLSKHLSGEAFDVQAVTDEARARVIKSSIKALAGLEKFVEPKGGSAVWHVQF